MRQIWLEKQKPFQDIVSGKKINIKNLSQITIGRAAKAKIRKALSGNLEVQDFMEAVNNDSSCQQK